MAILTPAEAQALTDAALARIANETLAKYQSEIDKYDAKIRGAADKGLDFVEVPSNDADGPTLAEILVGLGYSARYNNVNQNITIKW